jgi:hypothetical protein
MPRAGAELYQAARCTVADEQGAYRLELSVGKHYVTASARGFSLTSAAAGEPIQLSKGAPQQTADIFLREGARA